MPLKILGTPAPWLLEAAVNASNNNNNESTLRILHLVATIDIEINYKNKDNDATILFHVMVPAFIKNLSSPSSSNHHDLSAKLIPFRSFGNLVLSYQIFLNSNEVPRKPKLLRKV